MIRETRESDLEEVFNLIHAAFGNRAESDLVKQLISDGDVLINLLVESLDTIIGRYRLVLWRGCTCFCITRSSVFRVRLQAYNSGNP